LGEALDRVTQFTAACSRLAGVLEEWVECSYWGVKPKWRDKHGSKANGADQESKAFEAAAKKAAAEAATYDTLEQTSVNPKVVTG